MEYEGLRTGSHGDGPQPHWLVRLLGFVPLASLLAAANASLLGIASGARLSFLASISPPGLANTVGWLPSEVFLAIQSWNLHQAIPRAPPIPVAATTQDVVGNAHPLFTHNCDVRKRAAQFALKNTRK